ncbi:MAG: DUF2510 domain-containing protein [Leucobacter sp.]
MAGTPGWYPDPNDTAVEWYWNGSAYTEKRAKRSRKSWPSGWYPVEGNPQLQREWDGINWTGATRPTKRILGMVRGGDPKKAEAAIAQFHTQIQRLLAAQAAGHRGEARLAWIAAYAVVDQAFGPDSEDRWDDSLASIGFDPDFVRSPSIGSVAALSGGSFEAYEDFVTFNGQALDNNRYSTLTVFQDGQRQVTIVNVADKKGRIRPVQQVHDLRTAAIQVSGPTGALRANIHPDLAGYAHQVAAQFNARMQAVSPSAATTADLKEMIEAILGATGQPAAEKLQQLDRLRYERLLSDEDWKQAKARILDNV